MRSVYPRKCDAPSEWRRRKQQRNLRRKLAVDLVVTNSAKELARRGANLWYGVVVNTQKISQAVGLLDQLVSRAETLAGQVGGDVRHELGVIRELARDARGTLRGVSQTWIVRIDAGEFVIDGVDVCDAAHNFRLACPQYAKALLLGVQLQLKGGAE